MIVDRHTVSSWINLLLNMGFINPNPTSEYIRISPYHRMFMPNNETLYFVNIEVIEEYLQDFERKNTTHAPKTEKNQTKLFKSSTLGLNNQDSNKPVMASSNKNNKTQ